MSFQSCYEECAAVSYPDFLTPTGSVVTFFAFQSSAFILAALASSLMNQTYCFMPGVYYVTQDLYLNAGMTHMYLHACRGAEFRGDSSLSTQGYFKFGGTPIHHTVIEGFYFNGQVTGYTGIIQSNFANTQDNPFVIIRNNTIQMTNVPNTNNRGVVSLILASHVLIEHNVLVSTAVQPANEGIQCNWCNQTVLQYNHIEAFNFLAEITCNDNTGAPNYGYDNSILYNTGLNGNVGWSIIGQQLRGSIIGNTHTITVTSFPYCLSNSGYFPRNTTGNPNLYPLEPYAAGGPVVQNNTCTGIYVGIETGTEFLNFMYNVFIDGIAPQNTVAMGAADGSVFQYNSYVQTVSPSLPMTDQRFFGANGNSYCQTNHPCENNPGQVIGMNYWNGIPWYSWADPIGFVTPCCDVSRGCTGSICTPLSTWNTTWNFNGSTNSNLH